MLQSSYLVVNSPNEHQGSVLGRVVAAESSLELLRNVNRVIAITHAMKEVRAEIAQERKQQHDERLKDFLSHREKEAMRCRNAVLPDWSPAETATKHLELEDCPKRSAFWTRLAERLITF